MDNATAVTTTGVDLIKFAQSVTNLYYEKNMKSKVIIELENGKNIVLNENDVVSVKRDEKNIEIKAKNILETDDFLEILHTYM